MRLVPGLGTRAVDRAGDDYPVLIVPGQPELRVNVAVDEIVRYSPRQIDVHQPRGQRLRDRGGRRPAAGGRRRLSRRSSRSSPSSRAIACVKPVSALLEDGRTTWWSPSRGCAGDTPFVRPDPRHCCSVLEETLRHAGGRRVRPRRRALLPAAVPAAEPGRPGGARRRSRGTSPTATSSSRPTATSPTAGCRTSPTSSTSIRTRYAELETSDRAAGRRPGRRAS